MLRLPVGRISSPTPERLTKIFGRPNVASAAESTVRSYIVATRLGGTRYHRNPAQQLNGTAPLATYGSTKRYGAKALARRGLLIKRPARRTLWATTNFEARQTSHCVPRCMSDGIVVYDGVCEEEEEDEEDDQ